MSRLEKGSFLSQLTDDSKIDEDSIKLAISYYKDDIDHKLVNECYQFKEYIHHKNKYQNTEGNSGSKMQCTEVLQLICDQELTEVFPTFLLHNTYHKLGIAYHKLGIAYRKL